MSYFNQENEWACKINWSNWVVCNRVANHTLNMKIVNFVILSGLKISRVKIRHLLGVVAVEAKDWITQYTAGSKLGGGVSHNPA